MLSNNIDQGIDNDLLSEVDRNKLLEFEKELILLEQIELSCIMVPPTPIKTLWIHNFIQFGYIAFFSLVFPAAPVVGFLLNIFHINFLNFSFGDHVRRRKSVERGSIGIWNAILSFMSFSSLVINTAILVFTSDGLRKLLNSDSTTKYDSYTLILILVIFEHLVFLIKFGLTVLIANKPKWVIEYFQNQEIKKQMDEEIARKKEIRLDTTSIQRNALIIANGNLNQKEMIRKLMQRQLF